MKSYSITTCILVLLFSISACSNENPAVEPVVTSEPEVTVVSVEPAVTAVTDSHDHSTGSDFTPNYISAEDLNRRFEQKSTPFIFDVRNKASYQQSHIETAFLMPYGQTDDSDLAELVSLGKDSEIITYCGCPRHLSTLSADNLTRRGYQNVKVLYEGFWHWKDSGFPTFEISSNTATTLLKFEGLVESHQNPVSGIDLFLRHAKSGQLEAVRTDAQGKFDVEFHLFGYESDDKFDLMVSNVSAQPLLALTAAADKPTFIEVKL
jgi:rhodanese-related sulfurtransferase